MSDMDQTRVMGASDRTMVAPNLTGMGMGDMNRTQVGGVTTCPVCKSTTPLGEMYCGDCGFLLSSAPAANIEMPVEQAPAAELVDVVDGRRYRLRPGLNTLGRQGTDILVGESTVSRNHARLTVENGQVLIEDLGSSNGTKVGDQRLGPNQPVPATHGTPLKFGNWRVMLEVGGAQGSTAVAEKTTVVRPDDRTIVAPPTAEDKTMVGVPLADDKTVVGAPPAPEAAEPVAETIQAADTVLTPPVAEPLVEAAPKPPAGPAVAVLRLTKGTGSDISIPAGILTFGRKPNNDIVLSDSYISGRHAEITTDNTGTYLTDVGSTNGTVVNGQKLVSHEKQLLLDGDEVQLGQNTYLFGLLETAEEETAVESAVPVEMPSLLTEPVSETKTPDE
jgi:pSer/pThr/pTyr-binding forkhead associated (FHA) protein